MMIDAILDLYSRNLDYAKRLVADVPEDKMADMPGPGVNHAAWVIGHLAYVSDAYAKVYGPPPALPADWDGPFGAKSKPEANAKIYPSKAVLVKALEDAHAKMAAAVKSKPAAYWSQPPEDEKRRGRFPTMSHFLVHMCINHEAVHLGQFSAWRRVQGMPSV